MHRRNIKQRQQGAILVVSLLLLLVMTVLAVSASTSTRLQERMAGNERDIYMAFQGAEAALRDAEFVVWTEANAAGMRLINTCTNPTNRCVVDRSTTAFDFAHQDPTWWTSNARAYGDPNVQEFEDLVTDPYFRSELWTKASDSLTEGAKPNQQSGTAYYVNTSRSVGGTATAEVVVQSVYASPYVE